jgi:PAS domain S-box-containing protein
METRKEHRDLKPAGPAALSIMDRRAFKTLGVRIGVLGLSLACLFSAAGILSTYLSFDRSSPDSSILLSRTAAINGAAAALLAVICVYVAGIVFTKSISKRLEKFNAATQEAAAGNLDVRVDTPSGSTFEGLAYTFNGMMDRLSETTRSEAAQKQSLLAIIKAVESSGDAIAVAAAGRESTYYNKRFTELFGYSSEELNSATNKPLLHADPRVAAEISQAVSGGNSWTGELEMRTRAGNIIPVSLRTDAIKDENGTVTGRIEIHTDITQRKRSELLQSALYRVAEMTGSSDD